MLENDNLIEEFKKTISSTIKSIGKSNSIEVNFVQESSSINGETINLVDATSSYALTGCIIASDKDILTEVKNKLKHSAGNFYINDKPTGAVVGQQPFGGSRASGTNDKAGSELNLLRWVSVRTIKENFDPPKNYKYPFLEKNR